MGPATVDFETRSACSLTACGAYRYSVDPTTDILCMAYALPDWAPDRVALWHPTMPQCGLVENGETLVPLFEHIAQGGLLEAHNAMFEYAIWSNIFVPRYRVLPAPLAQWRCSAAKAAAHALPRGLEKAITALDLSTQKDDEFDVKKMAQPRKPLKAEVVAWHRQHAPCLACLTKGWFLGINLATNRTKRLPCTECGGCGYSRGVLVPDMPRLWHETPEQMAQLFAYCQQDVRAERALSAALPDLSPFETDVYLLDQEINERGFQLDSEAITTALTLIDQASVELNAELSTLVGRPIRATQRQQLREWFADNGLDLDDTQGSTLDAALEHRTAHLTPSTYRALEIMRALGKSSTAKYETMQDWLGPSDRVRGSLLYHGASTGRYTGRGVQPHNFPKGHSDFHDQERLWGLLTTGDHIRIITDAPVDKMGVPIYDSVMGALSQGLRGVIVPSAGRQLYVADYASIEARVLLWLAQDDEALGIFERGEDIYLAMAEEIYHRPCTKANDPKERALGKEATLACGYQMGAAKFRERCAAFGIDMGLPFAKNVVDAYRRKFWRVKQLWARVESEAIRAVRYQDPLGEEPGYVSWHMEGRFLYVTLPSGRRLAYADPEIHWRTTPWGDERAQLTFMGVNPLNHQWQRQTTYGGSLVENLVQAIARDILVDGMVRIDNTGIYDLVLSVHDETIAEADRGAGSLTEFEALLTQPPDWGSGIPIAVESWKGLRYRK